MGRPLDQRTVRAYADSFKKFPCPWLFGLDECFWETFQIEQAEFKGCRWKHRGGLVICLAKNVLWVVERQIN